jgi:hypothetical protein
VIKTEAGIETIKEEGEGRVLKSYIKRPILRNHKSSKLNNKLELTLLLIS